MKIVIIEDEELTANDLADTILSISTDYTIVKTLFSVKESIAYFKLNNDFDLIFSDIELGDGLSFEIFRKVNLNKPVIFCTAFNEYALQAFDSNGIDYMLKPFNQKSVEKSLTKLKNLRGTATKEDYDYNQLIEAILNKENSVFQSILCYQGDKIIPIKIENISLAYIENEIVYVIHNYKSVHVNHTMDELEAMLGKRFFRANRQIIIHRNAVKEVNQYFFRKLLVIPSINFNEQILVSKAKAKSFLEWLKK
ncbi:MAG: LytR/AlgR family response regulator transcription factor [Flavobacteriales bacterium]